MRRFGFDSIFPSFIPAGAALSFLPLHDQGRGPSLFHKVDWKGFNRSFFQFELLRPGLEFFFDDFKAMGFSCFDIFNHTRGFFGLKGLIDIYAGPGRSGIDLYNGAVAHWYRRKGVDHKDHGRNQDEGRNDEAEMVSIIFKQG